MIDTKTHNILYKLALGFALTTLVVSAWNAPISGDEYVHYEQSVKNINYIKTLGKDKSALDTPISRLKHYGQSFDTITTFLADVFQVKDVYCFRHVSNAIMAWLVIVFTSLISIKLTNSKLTGIITIILFLATGRFMGHAMNNLKDIPFTFAYIFSLYFIFRFVSKLPKISWLDLALLAQGIAFGISIRIGGLLIFALFILFTSLYVYFLAISGEIYKKTIKHLVLKLGLISGLVLVISYFSGILIWPYALENILVNPWKSLSLMHDYPTTVRQIFEGKLYWSDQFPWYYLFKYLLITLPLIVLLGFLLFFVFINKMKNRQGIILSIFILISFGFPLFYTATTGANVYGGWRQLLFALPSLIVLSSLGIWQLLAKLGDSRYGKAGAVLILIGLLMAPIWYSIRNYPYQYTYFNPLVGGTKGAFGNYEIDYYFTSYKKAYAYIDAHGPDAKIVAANFIIPEYYKDKSYKPQLIDYYQRATTDWNYAIICNTFLAPHSLKAGFWPPSNSIFTVDIDGVPILSVLKRENKIDLEGVKLMTSGKFPLAIEKLNAALALDKNNESILINLAYAYFYNNQIPEALSTVDRLLQIYPSNESAMDLTGEINLKAGKTSEAIEIFKSIIESNYKFYHAYVNLAMAYIKSGDQQNAATQLKACLRINPFYEPAYKVYGQLLIDQGEIELGEKMLQYSISGPGKYGIR